MKIVPINYRNLNHKDWLDIIIEIKKSKGVYDGLSDNEINANAIADYLELSQKGRFKNIDEINRIQYEYRKEYFPIFSLSGTKKNILLWSHYASSHKGLCIGYNTRKLEQFFEENYGEDGHEILLKKVNYYRKFPFFDRKKINDPYEFSIKSLITKSIDWEYEKEFRLISNIGKVNFAINLPEDVISEVNLGFKISEDDTKEIIELLGKKQSKII